MNSKTKNRNREDSPSLSSSSFRSPYNLRRNQAQPGAVAKRSSSSKPNKEISVITPQRLNQHGNGLVLQNTQNQFKSTSNQKEQDDEACENASNTNNSESEEQLQESEGTNDSENSDLEEPLEENDAEHSDLEEPLEESDDGNNMERSDDEEEALAHKHRVERQANKPPSVRKYFEHLTSNIYSCTYCRKSIKTYNCTDANLRSHLGRAHQMYDVMYKSQRQQGTPKPAQIKPDRKQELDDAAIDCIIIDSRPFGEFRRPGFEKFLSVACPGYVGPDRKTVRRQLGLAYHAYRAELRTALSLINSIAITVDIWSKKQTSFICITGHMFNNQYQSVAIVLGFRQLSGSHHAENIKNYIVYELRQLQIEDKICGIVSDNGSDIVKAINDIMPGKRYSCLAHDINRVVKNGLKLSEPKKKRGQAAQTTTESCEVDSEDFYDGQSESDVMDVPEGLEEDDDNDQLAVDDSGTDNVNGVTDTENLSDDDIGSDVEQNIEEDENQEIGEENFTEMQHAQLFARELVKRIRACIKNIRSTRVVSEYVKRQSQLRQPKIKCSLILDMEIRWNTTYIMIDRFLIYQFIVHEINRQPSKVLQASLAQQTKLASKRFEFDNNNWQQIGDLCKVLKPFFVATEIISAKNYPTLALGNTVQFALSNFLSTEDEKDSKLLRWFKFCLQQQYILYFDQKMAQHQKNNSLVAAFLDPTEYKHLRKRPVDFQLALTLLKVEMKKETQRTTEGNNTTNSGNITTSNSNASNSSSSTNSKQSNIESLFSLCGVGSSSSISSPSLKKLWSIEEEIGFYMSSANDADKVNFSSFWTDQGKHLQLMSAVVRRVSIIPASSVPCESTFSVAGYVWRKQRSALSPKALRYSLVLKDRNNLALLKPQVQQ